jgi:hypothetical protein
MLPVSPDPFTRRHRCPNTSPSATQSSSKKTDSSRPSQIDDSRDYITFDRIREAFLEIFLEAYSLNNFSPKVLFLTRFGSQMNIPRIICFTMLQVQIARSFSLRRHVTQSMGASLVQFRPYSSSSSTKLSAHDGEKSSSVETTNNSLEIYKNENNMRDQVFSAISKDGSVKVTVCTARNLLNDLMLAHSLTTTPADALGRTLVCSLLMSNGMQDEQTLQITMNCK